MLETQTHARLLDALHSLLRGVRIFGAAHPRAELAAVACARALQAAEPPFALQIVGHGLFRGYHLISLAAAHFERLHVLAESFARHGLHELRVDACPEPSTLLAMAGFLQNASAGEPIPELLDLELRGLPLAEAEAEAGDPPQDSDREGLALLRLHRAALEVEAVFAEGGCDAGRALAVVRGLEQSLRNDPRKILAALELNAFQWTAARRALSCALLTVAVLGDLGVQHANLRAIGHAALACAWAGLREPHGLTLCSAADEALRRLRAEAGRENFAASRHLLKVCALLRGLRQGRPGLAATGLLELSYGLERSRPLRPEAASRCELLAQLEHEGAIAEVWLRAALRTLGGVPAGSLAAHDGRVGLVLGPAAPPRAGSAASANLYDRGRRKWTGPANWEATRLELLSRGERLRAEQALRVLASTELFSDSQQ